MFKFNLFITSLITIIVSSCGSYKSLEIDEIKKLDFEYNPNQDLNYGTEFQATINAIMLDGEEINITDNKKLVIQNNDIEYLYGQTFKVKKKTTRQREKA